MYPTQITAPRLTNRPVFGYGGQLGQASTLPTTIEQMGTDISAAIQASTRPNVPAYLGNMVTLPGATAMSTGTALALGAGLIAFVLILKRRRR